MLQGGSKKHFCGNNGNGKKTGEQKKERGERVKARGNVHRRGKVIRVEIDKLNQYGTLVEVKNGGKKKWRA